MPEPNLLPLVVLTSDVNSIDKNLFVEDLNEYKSILAVLQNVADCNRESEVNFDLVKRQFERIALPSKRREILELDYQFSAADAFSLVSLNLDKILIEMIRINGDGEKIDANKLKNYKKVLLIDYLEALNKSEKNAKLLTVDKLADFVALLNEKKINKNTGNILIDLLLNDRAYEGKSPREIVHEKNLYVIGDVERIRKSVEMYLETNSDTCVKYHAKKKKQQQILDFVFGEIQKEYDNRADSVQLAKLIKQTLDAKTPQNNNK
jgi:Asp-tRNA(Asn)/Glu-tRNA(Gln) amidotransferase B subunit